MREEAGRILQTEELPAALSDSKLVASVGDVCTAALLGLGIVPKLAIIDGQTKRGAWGAPMDGAGFKVVGVKNPPETITRGLWAAIAEAYASSGSTLIVVEGEEDLASLACIHLAPEGTTVIYGVPDRGAIVIPVGAAIRSRTREVLAQMEE
jgi:hypothetical protein